MAIGRLAALVFVWLYTPASAEKHHFACLAAAERMFDAMVEEAVKADIPVEDMRIDVTNPEERSAAVQQIAEDISKKHSAENCALLLMMSDTAISSIARAALMDRDIDPSP